MRYRIADPLALVMALVLSSFPAFAGNCRSNRSSVHLERGAVHEMPSGIASRDPDVASDLARVEHHGGYPGVDGITEDATSAFLPWSLAGDGYTWSDG